MKLKQINFDMDGTIADFYNVEGWLDYLKNYDITPYERAKPLVDFKKLQEILEHLQNNGYEINIISWLSKNSNPAFDEAIIKTKMLWLQKYFPNFHFNKISIVTYGSPKSHYGKGILFDDEQHNRDEWELFSDRIAFDANNLLDTLQTFIKD